MRRSLRGIAVGLGGALAGLALAGCSIGGRLSLGGHASLGAWPSQGDCGRDDGARWSRIEAPADAPALLTLAKAHPILPDDSARAGEPDRWFQSPAGDQMLCRSLSSSRKSCPTIWWRFAAGKVSDKGAMVCAD